MQTVYLLSDPQNNAPRYVGITNNLKRRVQNHLTCSDATHRSCWIKSLLIKGFNPVMTVLEEVEARHRVDAEQAWILGFRQAGADLVNATDGGDGTLGQKFSPEAIQKMRIAQLGKTVSSDTRSKLRAANIEHAKTIHGSRHHLSKLSELQRSDIKLMASQGISQRDLALKHHVSISEIYKIISGRRG